jgi:ATP synthase protein I
MTEKKAAAERKLEERVDQQVRRMKRAKKDQPTLIGYTVYLGTLGLLFVLPVLVCAYIGRWLDERAGDYSVHWTLGFLLLGLIVGAANVYFFIRE